MTTQPSDWAVARARLFHDTYERLAPQFGYETRPDTKAFDPESPNGRLMTAVIRELDASGGVPSVESAALEVIRAHMAGELDDDMILRLSSAIATPRAAEAGEGWLRACDEEMVGAFLGVANPTDDYGTAKQKLHDLICWHIGVATDPAVNGGFKLTPVTPPEGQSVERRARELEQAQRLAVSLWERNYKESSPDWKVDETLTGVLLQISNMVSGMSLRSNADNRFADLVVSLRDRAKWGRGGRFTSSHDSKGTSRLLDMAADAIEQALTQQRGECYCQSCKGSGEVIGLHASPSGDPQDAYEAPMACPKCDGTGDAK